MQQNKVLEFGVANARAHSCYLIRNRWLIVISILSV